jgi:protein-disulfide isomerase
MPPARRYGARRTPLGRVAVALTGAAAIVAVLVAVSLLGSGADESEPAAPAAMAAAPPERDPILRGVPQDGIVLGDADAPVTLVEYADLQCPYCAQWSRDTFPAIVDEYVRTGRVRVVLRGLSFLGPDSETALRAALAAGEQDRLWDVVHGLFLRQGPENSGWVTEDVLRSFAGMGVDTEEMLRGTRSAWVERQLQAARAAAEAARVPGTPFFQAGRTGGALQRLEVSSLEPDGFRRELDLLLAA